MPPRPVGYPSSSERKHPKVDPPLPLDEVHPKGFGTRSCMMMWPGTSKLRSDRRVPQQREMSRQNRFQRHHRNQARPERSEKVEHTLEMEPVLRKKNVRSRCHLPSVQLGGQSEGDQHYRDRPTVHEGQGPGVELTSHPT
eukprot:scaffold18925_cov71-Cylindrotheca_fusiformis.AAC.1